MDYILVQARTGSKRLKNKILKKINRKTILENLIIRLKKVKKIKKIIVLTTKKKEDNSIINLLKKININYFRGSENDLVLRFYDCVKKHNIKNIIRITSDCVLIDPKLIDKFYKFYKSKKYDYVSNTTPPEKSSFPDGSDIEIFSSKALIKVHKMCKNKIDREHLTNYFWKSKKFKTYTFKNDKNLSNYKYSLDYKEDLTSIKKIFTVLNKRSQFGYTKEIINIINVDKKLFQRMKLTKKLYLKNRFDLNKISCEVILHSDLNMKNLNDIIQLKKQEWQYEINSQKKWIKNKIQNNDLHILLKLNNKTIGYTMLRILRKNGFSKYKKIIYFDTHIIEKTLRGKNISSFLMQEAIKQINKKKTLAILRCNKKLKKYYRNYKWKDVSKYIKFNDNKKLTSMVYPISKFRKKDFIDFNLVV